MNKNFWRLPDIKQQRILNAGYKVFSSNTYKKASMQLIADDAGISKSLLFHYFRNKQSLYEFLFQTAIQMIQDQKNTNLYKEQDFFELLENEFHLRFKLLEKFPFQYRFIMRVYDEKSLVNSKEVTRIILESIKSGKVAVLKHVDKSMFRHKEDLENLYDMIIDLSNGFYFRVFNNATMEKQGAFNEFRLYLTNLRRNYYKEG
ncbi:TetR family transcriptional regulator [Bacillus sp. J14TS2]|uniref:TetR/AcrR family transcriptional regulator n=1 Tax=Bacillus sp. J14TS2 TaxID=2807188 RepID=UPI001AFCEDD8|nr:TetR/AcrR family transcriptional regulator [Bacillus sp. J14TS2]GIN72686.1 TetR family transcriptional regulator [Bacillus sp. J14TS2]